MFKKETQTFPGKRDIVCVCVCEVSLITHLLEAILRMKLYHCNKGGAIFLIAITKKNLFTFSL